MFNLGLIDVYDMRDSLWCWKQWRCVCFLLIENNWWFKCVLHSIGMKNLIELMFDNW